MKRRDDGPAGKDREIDRRNFIRVSALAAGGAALGCSSGPTEPAEQPDPPDPPPPPRV